jgi:hypothetical protein
LVLHGFAGFCKILIIQGITATSICKLLHPFANFGYIWHLFFVTLFSYTPLYDKNRAVMCQAEIPLIGCHAQLGDENIERLHQPFAAQS